MTRFLISIRHRRGAARELAIDKTLQLAFQTDDCNVWVAPGPHCVSLGEHGLICGALFHRHGPARRITSLDQSDIRDIVQTRGAKLLSNYWGGYVALILDGDQRLVLRDPSGAMPCFLARTDDYWLASSDTQLLLSAGQIATAIDWNALARHLHDAGLPTHRTALTGIDELLPGFQLDPSEPPDRQTPWWSPWDHVEPGYDLAEAPERLRRVVLNCAQSWTSGLNRILLSVSGGLDSSILAACFARAGGPEVHCVTMYGDDPAGDEREHARTLCAFLNLPLVERRYHVENVDIDRPLAPHLPRPTGRTQADAYEKAHIELAMKLDADAFVTGNGGDNVFAYSQSAGAIADRLLAQRSIAGPLSTLRDVCRQTGCSAMEALAATARILRGPRAYQWRPSMTFLSPAMVVEPCSSRLAHPWLKAPTDALPGKAAHIAGILRVQHNLEPGRSQFAPVLNPLMAQPVMQACLAIPSWQWRQGGVDRAVARTAFSRDLPKSIVARRAKGGPDGFTARLVAHYRPQIRERLLEGQLAAQGIVDRQLIARTLADERPMLGEERTRLLALLSAEAWLRCWSERLRTSA